MSKIELNVYHTPYYNGIVHKFPIIATGYEQWLGDGFYFWGDSYFAEWWGHSKKCNGNIYKKFIIYKSTLTFDEEDFIDTVFNEEDYLNFVEIVEKFAKKYQKQLKSIPNLEEFNEFIEDFEVWTNLKVIRFQDLPVSNSHILVNGYYYKKRIQIRVNDPSVISTFTPYKEIDCI